MWNFESFSEVGHMLATNVGGQGSRLALMIRWAVRCIIRLSIPLNIQSLLVQ